MERMALISEDRVVVGSHYLDLTGSGRVGKGGDMEYVLVLPAPVGFA